jgi:hypothetical protein
MEPFSELRQVQLPSHRDPDRDELSTVLSQTVETMSSRSWNIVRQASSGPSSPAASQCGSRGFGGVEPPPRQPVPQHPAAAGPEASSEGSHSHCFEDVGSVSEVAAAADHALVDWYPPDSMEFDAVLAQERLERRSAGQVSSPLRLQRPFGKGTRSQAQPQPFVMSLATFLEEEVPDFPFSQSAESAEWLPVQA